ncbi:coenzyme Q-binding protein COQ10 homolog A, mitochondrial [Rhodnius prolixus]
MIISLKPWLSRSIYCNIFNQRNLTSWKKEYSDHKIAGFTIDQMFEVVSDVENYAKFLPFCRKSVVHSRTEKELLGELEVGFPPVVESYVSKVTLVKPYLVKADCTDGRLFHHLTTTWRFTKPPLRDAKRFPNSCSVHFYVSFEFKSLLHSQLANIFFDHLVTEMEAAFYKEAYKRYGTPTKLDTDTPT